MKRFLGLAFVSTILLFTMTRCGLLFAILGGSDNCERYSIYRSTLFGADELLWEETDCNYNSAEIEARFNEKFDYYTDLYSGSYVYKEHVTYAQ